MLKLTGRCPHVFLLMLTALLAGCCCCGGAPQPPPVPETDEEAVRRTVGEYITAVAAGDDVEFCRVSNFSAEDMDDETRQHLRQAYAEKHQGLDRYDLEVVEITGDFAQLVAEIYMRDGYSVTLGKDNPGLLPDVFLPTLYQLKKEDGDWRLRLDLQAPSDSATKTADEFVRCVLEGDDSYGRLISERHSSTQSQKVVSSAVQSIHKFRTSTAKVKEMGLSSRGFNYRSRIRSINPLSERVDYGFRVSPESNSWNMGELDSIVVAVIRENDQWKVSLDDTHGISEIGKLPNGIPLASKDGPKSSTSKSKALRRPTNADELKNFARKVARAAGESIMKDIGGGQDLVVNVVNVNFDRIADEYEIDIQVSFNGKVFRSDNYQVSGRITIHGDGTKADFARTAANEKYLEWEDTIGTAGLVVDILDAATKE